MDAELGRRLEELGHRGHRALAAGVGGRGGRECAGWSADGAAPDASSLFEIGSITKAFTGVLLADMVLRGEVGFDDPISHHLERPRPAWRHREPTLLELATHRSGLPNAPKGLSRRELAYSLGVTRRDPWAGVDERDYLARAGRASPRGVPGRRWRYSSFGFGLLGDALAARAGCGYEALLAERVLTPIGLTATAVSVPASRSGKLMRGHARNGRPRPPLEDFMPAAGSLRSSVHDMLAFLAASLEPPPEAPGPALWLAQRPYARLSRGLHMGLGWMLLARRGMPRTVFHVGGTWGFRSFAGFAPGSGTTAVVLSNTARRVESMGFELLRERH